MHLQRWDGALLQRGQQTNQIKGSVGWMQGVFVSTWRMFCLISQGCFAGWAAALIWVTSIRQGRMERSVLTAGRALMISCEGRRAAAPWSASDCTWAAPVRTAGLQNGTCGDTRACLALRNSWTNVIGETGQGLVWVRSVGSGWWSLRTPHGILGNHWVTNRSW